MFQTTNPIWDMTWSLMGYPPVNQQFAIEAMAHSLFIDLPIHIGDVP